NASMQFCFDPILKGETVQLRSDRCHPPKTNILVVFYSRDGSVEALAKAVSEGAREAGAEVRLRRVPDLVSSDVMTKVPEGAEFRANPLPCTCLLCVHHAAKPNSSCPIPPRGHQ